MKSIYAELPPVEVAGTKLVGRVVFALLVLASALIGAFGGLLLVYSTDLPEVGELQRYRPSTITELYDDQGRVVGSFALQRRVVVGYDDFPKVLRDAIISVEDKDFEKHWGVNFWRILGAAYKDIALGQKAQGGSTLTMQLSRNLFLTPERRFHRKIQEIMLAIQIERRFTKPQIFTLYANQIFLGHGAYGFEAGSQFYFSKHAKDLTLEEAALLAGLPKAPNYYSPLNNPERAARRRNLVINAMLEDGKITADQAAHAKSMPILLHLQNDPNSLAPYFAEEVRRYLEKKYGTDEVHQGGLRVYTTLNQELQEAANRALLDGLAAYERRHGWKGNLPNMVAAGLDLDKYQHPDWDEPMAPGSYVHALVTGRQAGRRDGKVRPRSRPTLAPADIAWTRHKSPQEILARGDIAYVKVVSLSDAGAAKVSLEQDSGAQGALLAIDNATGDIKAMVGGRDFDESKFNRATQAMRQVGSSFKPYVYTAAIDNGATPDDIILDAPVTYSTASGPYSPHNYDGKFEGNITLRRAIAQSRNIPALKTAARRRHQHRHRVRAQVRRHLAAPSGAAACPGRRRHDADGANLRLHHLPQRRRTCRATIHSQGRGLRRPHPGRELSRRGRRHQPAHRAHHDFPAARGGAARHRLPGQQAQASARRENRHHQRFHRRLVCRLLALHHLRRLDRLRREKDARQERKRGAGRPARLD